MTRKRRSIYIQYILCFSSRKCIRKQKNIILQAFTFKSPSVEGVRTDQCEVQTNQPPNRAKRLPTLLKAQCTKISLQLQGSSKVEEYESADLCGKNLGRPTMKNSVKFLHCTHRENLKTILINKGHLSAISQKQRSKLTKNKKLVPS